MKVKDLYTLLKFYIDENMECLEFPVVIPLSESSIGSRMMAGVSNVYQGLDWENGKMILEPNIKLVRNGRGKNDLMPVDIYAYEGDRRMFCCPRCNERVSKSDNYCRNCGQRVYYDQDIKPLDSWREKK